MRYFLIVMFSLNGLIACSNTDEISIVPLSSILINETSLKKIGNSFYDEHADSYDFLVIWSDESFGPANSFYLPVQNNIQGIGYRQLGSEFFNHAADFGSQRLQGIVWMGTDWVKNKKLEGRRSILGILAHETMHRWGANLDFLDKNGQVSNALHDSTYHWNFSLNAYCSPLGGNDWHMISANVFKALPCEKLKLSPLDKYIMGMISKNEVPTIMVLNNPININGQVYDAHPSRPEDLKEEILVSATPIYVSIDQIIDVEGLRTNSEKKFDAKKIKQAWIYLHSNSDDHLKENFENLKKLHDQWPVFYSDITNGLSVIESEPK